MEPGTIVKDNEGEIINRNRCNDRVSPASSRRCWSLYFLDFPHVGDSYPATAVVSSVRLLCSRGGVGICFPLFVEIGLDEDGSVDVAVRPDLVGGDVVEGRLRAR